MPDQDAPTHSVRHEHPPDAFTRLLTAGFATGVCDGLFAIVLSLIYPPNVTQIFQGVASTLLGKSAFDGGGQAAGIGWTMHFGVAFGWSAFFLVLHERWPWLRRQVASRAGAVRVAAVYGPFVWLVMSLVFVPFLTQRPMNLGNYKWWVQLIGHFPFVGLPIILSVRLPRFDVALPPSA